MIRGPGRVALSALLAVALLPVACNDTGTGPVSPAPVAMVIPATTVAITADVGGAVPDSISVRVLDAAGNGIAGVAVQFTPSAGGGSVSPSTVTSGANGVARTMWTLGSAAGTQTLEVRTGNSTVAALVVQATARAAAPAQVQKPTGDPTAAPAGSPVPLMVLVVDRFGNPTAGVSVTWQAVAGGGSVSPSVSVSDNSGQARTTWTLGSAGTNRVDASVSAAIAATFTATATVVIAPVAAVSVTASAPTMTVGGNVTLAVTTRDANGNVLTGRAVSFVSSAPAIATVDAGGVVRALSAGQTTITATSEGKTAQIVVTVNAAPPVAPAAPTGLTATAATSNQINLAWQDNSGDETEFSVEGQGAGATTWTPIATVAPNTAQYSHTSLPPSTTYTYRVRACANAVCSAYSNTASASTPPAAGTSAPSVTTGRVIGVTRDPMGGPDAATFSSQTIPNGLPTTTWFEWGTSPTLASVTSTPTKDAGAGTTPFENLQSQFGLAQATTYYYRGVAQNSAGTTRGAILSFTTVQPSAPQGVQLALTATGLGVVVTWTHAGENGTVNYQIKRREGTTTVAVPGGFYDYSALRSFTDSTYALNAGHTFFYTVTACNYLGCATSPEASIATPPLAAPSALTVTGSTATSVSLSWTDNAANETAYWVWRRAVGPTGASLVGKLPANATSFTDDGTPFSGGGNPGAPVTGTTYFYYVVAQGRVTNLYNPNDYSAPSNEVQVVPGGGGGSAPTVTTGRVIAVTRDPMGGPDAATFSSQTIPNGLPTTTWFEWGTSPTLATVTSTPPKDAGAGTTPFENFQSQFGLAQATTYYYRGVAQNSAGTTRGAILSFTTVPPSAPQGVQVALTATGLGVVVQWTHAGENGTVNYQVKRREGTTTVAVPGMFYDYSALRSGTDSTYTLNASHTFFYTVTACNYLGCATSPEVSITTPPLAAPSNLTVTGTTATSVSLSWTDNAANETANWVWRRAVGPTAAQLVGRLPANATSFTDDGTAIPGSGAPVTGTTYFYYVVAQGRISTTYNPNDYSAPSNEVQVVPGGGGGSPPAVTTGRVLGVTRDPMGGPDAATLSSQTIPNGLPTTTWFEWGTSPTLATVTSTPTKDAGAGTTPFENFQSLFGLAQATTYYYRGVAQNSAGTTRGAILSFTTVPPSAPQGVQVALTATGLGVVVTWTHAGENGTVNYQIKRREGTTTVAVPGGFYDYSALRSFTDSTYALNAGHTFFYTVTACNYLGCATSPEASIATPPLAAPSALTVTGSTATSVSLSWTDNAGNETAYWVWRRAVGSTAALLVGKLPANATSFTDDGTAISGPGAPVTGTT